jgi:hypothetical protein
MNRSLACCGVRVCARHFGPCATTGIRKSSPRARQKHLARISHHGSGRAGLQPRRYKAFLIVPVSRAPRSPSADGLRGARDQQRAGVAISAGLKPRPSRSPLRASKRGEKSGLALFGVQTKRRGILASVQRASASSNAARSGRGRVCTNTREACGQALGRIVLWPAIVS